MDDINSGWQILQISLGTGWEPKGITDTEQITANKLFKNYSGKWSQSWRAGRVKAWQDYRRKCELLRTLVHQTESTCWIWGVSEKCRMKERTSWLEKVGDGEGGSSRKVWTRFWWLIMIIGKRHSRDAKERENVWKIWDLKLLRGRKPWGFKIGAGNAQVQSSLGNFEWSAWMFLKPAKWKVAIRNGPSTVCDKMGIWQIELHTSAILCVRGMSGFALKYSTCSSTADEKWWLLFSRLAFCIEWTS